MVKLGFFLNTPIPSSAVNFIVKNSNASYSGVWLQENSPREGCYNSPIYDSEDELICNSDIAIIGTSNNFTFDLAAKAIKKGVIPIFADMPGLSYTLLNQLNLLSAEMGISIGFGLLGFYPAEITLPLEIPFIAYLKRRIDTSNLGADGFRAILTYDLASALKLSKLDIHRVKLFCLPHHSNTPNHLMVTVDFNNNSVFTYTLQNQRGSNHLDIEVFAGRNSRSLNYTYSDIHRGIDAKGIVKCINGATAHTKPGQDDIELAMATARLTEEVMSKINP